MPYVITTRQAAEPPNQRVAVRAAILSRVAVATLDEARLTAYGVVVNASSLEEWLDDDRIAACEIPEAGGTIGPLPDGTVIEVEGVSYGWLWEQITIEQQREIDMGPHRADSKRQTIAAYNAVEEA